MVLIVSMVPKNQRHELAFLLLFFAVKKRLPLLKLYLAETNEYRLVLASSPDPPNKTGISKTAEFRISVLTVYIKKTHKKVLF